MDDKWSMEDIQRAIVIDTYLTNRDKEIFNAQMDEGYFDNLKIADKDLLEPYKYEQMFFTDIINCIQKHFSVDLNNVKLWPRREFDMNTSIIFQDGIYYITTEDRTYDFIINFCANAFYITMQSIEGEEKKKYMRRLLALIDIYYFRNKYLQRGSDDLDVYINNQNSIYHAALVSRAMYTYLLCHEIAHIVLNPKQKPTDVEDEFTADALAYKYYSCLIQNEREHKYLVMYEGLRRVPLLLFDLMELKDFYQELILQKTSHSINHPDNAMRKSALLYQYEFGNDEECMDLYLLVYEQIESVRYFLYQACDNIRQNIANLHGQDYNL